MRTNLLGYILATPGRQRIVKTLLEYPVRQWSCSSLEEVAKLPHATVFRTIQKLQYFGLLRSSKVNKRDIIYQLISTTPLLREIKRILQIELQNALSIAKEFSRAIISKSVSAIILYGSAAKGTMKPGSDIDILVVVEKHYPKADEAIYDKAAAISLKYNLAVSPVIMSLQEIEEEKGGQFLQSAQESMEVLYGKAPF